MKAMNCHDADFVVTGDTKCCLYGNICAARMKINNAFEGHIDNRQDTLELYGSTKCCLRIRSVNVYVSLFFFTTTTPYRITWSWSKCDFCNTHEKIPVL